MRRTAVLCGGNFGQDQGRRRRERETQRGLGAFVRRTRIMSHTTTDYKSDVKITWCPGCGDFAVLNTLYQALATLDLDPKNVVVGSGIGCWGRLPIFVNSYGFHGVHGRVLPTAMGVKLGNPKLHVIAVGGDGDGLAIGGGHFSHAARRNIDITYIMLDNSIYGLTKGQASPTTGKNSAAKNVLSGTLEDDNLNPVNLALPYNASCVARGFPGQLNQLIDLIVRAAKTPGFSFLHVISPCVVFNNTYPYYTKNVSTISAEHDSKNKIAALSLANEPGKTHI